MNNKDNLNIKYNNIDLDGIFLINEKQYQKKVIKDDKAIFQIIDIDSNKVLKEIVIEKN